MTGNPFAQMMINAYPQQWAAAQKWFGSHDDKISALRELYKQKGLDLDATAKQYGVQL